MVVTDPSVIKYIEEFEALKTSDPLPETQLSGRDQVILYTITEMFNTDEVFRTYISLLLYDFSKKRITLEREELGEALTGIAAFALHLNKKE